MPGEDRLPAVPAGTDKGYLKECYMNLTWKQFKEVIDKQMKDKGISEDTEIHYIDISFPQLEGMNEVEVFYDKELGMIAI